MLIPEDRQGDLLDTFWVLLREVESSATKESMLTRLDVESGYRILRDIGYTKAYPQWENK